MRSFYQRVCKPAAYTYGRCTPLPCLFNIPTRFLSQANSLNKDKSSDGEVLFPSDMATHRSSRKKGTSDQTVKAFRPPYALTSDRPNLLQWRTIPPGITATRFRVFWNNELLQVDPTTTSILLFPGQGSQFVGMGKRLLENNGVREYYTIASDIVKYDLLKHCLEGPIETLSRTDICQVATLVTSVAALHVLRDTNPQALESCVSAAGFSVGEYAALVMAGAISFEDAVQLVQARANAMQAASDRTPSGLMTVFLTHSSRLKFAMMAAREFCSQRLGIEDAVCSIANYLCHSAKVIGGNIEALEFIQANRSEFSLSRVKMLPVSGAFHTKLMLSAAEQFREVLKETEFREPVVPVYSNVHGTAYRNAKGMKVSLEQQLYMPVKWEQLMHTLYHRPKSQAFPNTYEVGPGSQLGTMLKVVNNQAHKSYTSVEV